VALALVLCAVKVGFVVTGTLQSGGVTPLALLTAVSLTLPLAWRRTAPLAVACVVSLVVAGDDLMAGWDAAVLSFDASIIASYSAGAFASQRRSVIALAALALGNLVDAVVAPGALAGNVGLALVVFTGAPWLVGQALRRERGRTHRIEVLAEQLAEEREQRAREAVAAERVRLARELHDVVGHAMSVIAVQADAAAKVLPVDPDRAAEPLADIQTTARGALDEMRRLVGLLRVSDEPPRGPQPGLADLHDLVDEVRGTGLGVTLHVSDADAERPDVSLLADVPPTVGFAAYRIIQEGLTNVRKHARCPEAEVRVQRRGTQLVVEIRDRGIGRQASGAAADTRGGLGLVGIRERVSLLGGTLHTGPAEDGRGFVLRAGLPLEPVTT
jgi:signal transduction histidine kinase